LSVDELQQLERNLETGLHRVLQTKVCWLNMAFYRSSLLVRITTSNCLVCCFLLQDQQFLDQINELQRKVELFVTRKIIFEPL
jgi:hypothetical protein